MSTKSGDTDTISVLIWRVVHGVCVSVACEGGIVNLFLFGSIITTVVESNEEKIVVEDETGVPPEVRKWGEVLAAENP